jgi:branched-chain amino acid transport system ATP-binding protein
VSDGEPALAVRGLSVSFGPVEVCAGIDLDLPEGGLGALVGTNGAGKSTILRALAGLVPSRGRVRLSGEEISGLSPRARVGRGLVLAVGGAGTFPSLTVEESLAVGNRGPVDEAYSLFPSLAARRRQRAGSLSAGEQQLVTLARALLAHPRVLLVDELTWGLTTALAEEVVHVVAGRGNAVVVDQSISRVLGMASSAWFLQRGTIRFSGPPGELLARHDLLQPVLPA